MQSSKRFSGLRSLESLKLELRFYGKDNVPVCYTKRVYIRDPTKDLLEEAENLKLIVEMTLCDFRKHVSSWHILHDLAPFTMLYHRISFFCF